MTKLKIQVLSDIHTERDVYKFNPDYYKTDADIIIVAGDIAHLLSVGETLYTLFQDKPVIFVMGNHEHYQTGYPIDTDIRLLKAEFNMANKEGFTNITFLDDDVHIINVKGINIRCVGGTLWTDFNLYHNPQREMNMARYGMNDYRYIIGRNGLLTPEETRDRHLKTYDVIKNTLETDFDGPTFVVTHHLPSLRAVKPRYKKDKMSASFASSLDDLLNKNATLWCFGHTHDTSVFRSHQTLFVCNPEGYRRNAGEADNKRFNPHMLIDVRRGAPDNKWKAGVLK